MRHLTEVSWLRVSFDFCACLVELRTLDDNSMNYTNLTLIDLSILLWINSSAWSRLKVTYSSLDKCLQLFGELLQTLEIVHINSINFSFLVTLFAYRHLIFVLLSMYNLWIDNLFIIYVLNILPALV